MLSRASCGSIFFPAVYETHSGATIVIEWIVIGYVYELTGNNGRLLNASKTTFLSLLLLLLNNSLFFHNYKNYLRNWQHSFHSLHSWDCKKEIEGKLCWVNGTIQVWFQLELWAPPSLCLNRLNTCSYKASFIVVFAHYKSPGVRWCPKEILWH